MIFSVMNHSCSWIYNSVKRWNFWFFDCFKMCPLCMTSYFLKYLLLLDENIRKWCPGLDLHFSPYSVQKYYMFLKLLWFIYCAFSEKSKMHLLHELHIHEQTYIIYAQMKFLIFLKNTYYINHHSINIIIIINEPH